MPNPEQYPGYGVEELDQQLEKTMSWLSRNVSTASGNPLAYVKPGHEPSIFKPRTVVGGEGAPMGIMKEVTLIKTLPKILKIFNKAARKKFWRLQKSKAQAKIYRQILNSPKEEFPLIKELSLQELRPGTLGQYSQNKTIQVDPVKASQYSQDTFRHEFTHARQYAGVDKRANALLYWTKQLEDAGVLNYTYSPIEIHASTVGKSTKPYKDVYDRSLDYILTVLEEDARKQFNRNTDPDIICQMLSEKTLPGIKNVLDSKFGY